MKTEFIKVEEYAKERAVIMAVEVNEEIQQAMELLSGKDSKLAVYQNASVFFCKQRDIYYVESVDDRTFVYTKDDCFEVKKKLYELEKILDYSFMRSSKSMICNTKKIKSVKSEYHGRMKAVLLNGEEIVISRTYVKHLKERLGI